MQLLPQTTSCVALETSRGVLVIDLFGRDSPKGVANFVDLCQCGYFIGAQVTRINAGNFIEIRNTLFDEAEGRPVDFSFDGIVDRDPTRRLDEENHWLDNGMGFLLPGSCAPTAAAPVAVRTKQPFPLNRRGLVMLRNDGFPGSISSKLLIATTTKPLDFLAKQVTVIGIVQEGLDVVDAIAATTTRAVAAVSLGVAAATPADVTTTVAAASSHDSPVRMIRIKHSHVVVDYRAPDSKSDELEQKRHRARENLMDMQLDKMREIQRCHDEENAKRRREDDARARELKPWLPLRFVPCAGETEDHSETVGVAINPHFRGIGGSSGGADGLGEAAELLSSEGDEADRAGGGDRLLSRVSKDVVRATVDRTRNTMMKLLQDTVFDEDLAPPENVLFVAKLNPVTTSQGLRSFFSQVGRVTSCDVVKHWRTGESLQYAFVEFETVEMCNRAYNKLQGALVDHCRIRLDFSQSVAGEWAKRCRERREQREQRKQEDPRKRLRE